MAYNMKREFEQQRLLERITEELHHTCEDYDTFLKKAGGMVVIILREIFELNVSAEKIYDDLKPWIDYVSREIVTFAKCDEEKNHLWMRVVEKLMASLQSKVNSDLLRKTLMEDIHGTE